MEDVFLFYYVVYWGCLVDICVMLEVGVDLNEIFYGDGVFLFVVICFGCCDVFDLLM